MEDQERIEVLLYELSSESRLNILRGLNEKNRTMTGIASNLNLTTTEASRQLQRLSDTLLAQKQPDGTYSITFYGRLVLHFCSHLDFVARHKEYFLTHDALVLSPQFLSRLGELSGSNLKLHMLENINTAQRMVRGAEEYIWSGGEEPPVSDSMLRGSVPEGIKCRFLFLERFLPKEPSALKVARNMEFRSIDRFPVSLLMTEKGAFVSFHQINGRTDHAGFVGEDPIFHNWVRDLFLYYWEQGRRIY
ncbi:MAG TPA: transcriptional regulator FilR1 domain-containing protein [Methanoregulaceae archaeon]|nr:transcriptional regulator FilR1 domain-containing protein [Methanoregulaceae archaeon]